MGSAIHEASFWEREGKGLRCGLCSHRCLIKDGKRGLCGVREASKGRLLSLVYGRASSIAVDPVEKKPLYHFKPGSRILSIGTAGCNFRCLHCQNNDISCAGPESFFLRDVGVKEVSKMALTRNCQGIAWTYNEPTIWYEFTRDASKEAKKKGLDTMYVTNGYITPEALEEHAPYLDAMNIDVKVFTEDFYK
ncbi:MAG: radical SAM protein, partial [Thermoplasmata archaeon]|nr:radical SAM protein [Thermoplasmata archaeon]